MFNSVILDVVIGLVFIYLVYSLLATIIQELIASLFRLRAKTLEQGISRMLDDDCLQDKPGSKSKGVRFILQTKLGIGPKTIKNTDLSTAFYKHPSIKYLGSGKSHSKPSYVTAENFSKVLVDLLRGKDVNPGDNQKILIQRAIDSQMIKWSSTKIGDETHSYLKSIWADSEGDIKRFRDFLEKWFDDTMERATGWYKKQTQKILLIIGLFIAIIFNADTFVIVKNLSVDKDAREKLVNIATAYLQNNNTDTEIPETVSVQDSKIKSYEGKNDTLNKIREKLDIDMIHATTLLGLGSWPSDSVKVFTNKKTNIRTYSPLIDEIPLSSEQTKIQSGIIYFSTFEKFLYFLRMIYHHFFGFLVTALAVSLGSPFWFDLLNKLTQLRGSKQTSRSANSEDSD